MPISDRSGASDAETPMLSNSTVDAAVNHNGQPAWPRSTGGWRSAYFIIGVEIAERFAYWGIGANLVMYLTGPLRQSTAVAAVNVNAWSAAASLLPLFGAFVADSSLGRYTTITLASLLYIFGLGLLTLSVFLPSLTGSDCQSEHTIPCDPSLLQVILFFFALYLVAIAQGGHKPCTQAFGADQFDDEDPEECIAKSSFFNWWYFGVCAGGLVTTFVVSYIQENFSWGLGFGIPCIAMVVALVVFLLGTRTYRYSIMQNEKGPFMRIGKVFVAAFRNRRIDLSIVATQAESQVFLPHKSSQQFKFLNKALTTPNHSEEGLVCSEAEVEEAKAVLRLFPIWGTCLVYGIVFAQIGTLFTKQAATMNRTIISRFTIPAATFQSISTLVVLISLPIYDRLFVPIARAFTTKPSGITMLQRIGTGIFLSIILMIIAALVEIKRLKTAREQDLLDKPSETLPMTIWWLAPQNVLFGVAEMCTMVGLQEFFYDQVPTELRSIGIALYLSVFGVGSFLSSVLIAIIEKTTTGEGRCSWFSNNLNHAHLDYFYWLLAGLSALGFASYLHSARCYIYNRKGI